MKKIKLVFKVFIILSTISFFIYGNTKLIKSKLSEKIVYFEDYNRFKKIEEEKYLLFKTDIETQHLLSLSKRGISILNDKRLSIYNLSLKEEASVFLVEKPSFAISEPNGKRIALFIKLSPDRYKLEIFNSDLKKTISSYTFKTSGKIKPLSFLRNRIFFEEKINRENILFYYDIFRDKKKNFLMGYKKIVGIADYGSSVVFWGNDKKLYKKIGNFVSTIKEPEYKYDASLNNLGYIAYGSKKTLYVLNLRDKKIIWSYNIKNDFKIIKITPQGKRVFLKINKSIYFIDPNSKAPNMLKINSKISEFKTICNGEMNLFIGKKNKIYTLFLSDITPPYVLIKVKPLFKGETFIKKPEIRVWPLDLCFISGAKKNVVFKFKNKITKGRKFYPELTKGDNSITIIVYDNAENKTVYKKIIKYSSPINATIKDIERNPLKYKNKILRIKGYGKGKNAKVDKNFENFFKKPFSKNNFSPIKNSGVFSDGKLLMHIPMPVNEKGFFYVYGRIEIKKNRWAFLPLYAEKINN